MSNSQEEPRSTPAPGIVESFKALLLTFVSSLYTRLEIATTELEEERERLEQLVLLGVAAVFCLCMGVLLVSLLLIALAWDTPYRMLVFSGVTALYLIAGICLGLILRAKVKSKPRLFGTTLSELAKDYESLRKTLP